MEATTDKKIEPTPPLMPEPLEIKELEAEQEYRITDILDHIKVIVSPEPAGICEVFGRELPPGEPVFFHMGQKIAIYCWQRCSL
jgi:hypothetical protein